MRVVTGVYSPYGISFNSRREVIVSEEGAHSVSVFDIKGQRVRTFGSCSDRPEQMEYPAGIAIDDVDNIFVGNLYELQKLVVSSYKESCNNNPMYEELRQKFTSRG